MIGTLPTRCFIGKQNKKRSRQSQYAYLNLRYVLIYKIFQAKTDSLLLTFVDLVREEPLFSAELGVVSLAVLGFGVFNMGAEVFCGGCLVDFLGSRSV